MTKIDNIKRPKHHKGTIYHLKYYTIKKVKLLAVNQWRIQYRKPSFEKYYNFLLPNSLNNPE